MKNPFDLTDILLISGIGFIWGSLYTQIRWLSFLVLGLILFCLGLVVFKSKMGG